MALTPQLWSMTGLATELGVDRRRIAKALAETPQEVGEGRNKRWYMKTAARALLAPESEGLDVTEERARLLREQADKQEMENALRRGELREAADVDAAVISAFSRVRSRLLAIPSKIAPKVLTAKDAHEVEMEVNAAVREALRELSETSVGELEEVK